MQIKIKGKILKEGEKASMWKLLTQFHKTVQTFNKKIFNRFIRSITIIFYILNFSFWGIKFSYCYILRDTTELTWSLHGICRTFQSLPKPPCNPSFACLHAGCRIMPDCVRVSSDVHKHARDKCASSGTLMWKYHFMETILRVRIIIFN